MKIKSKTYGKYNKINFILEANSFAATNCTGQLCITSHRPYTATTIQ